MVIASGSACGGASSKLRRSRRLSSTRGLKRVAVGASWNEEGIETRSGKTSAATMNWELNERISLSSGSSPGLEVRPDARRGIELSGNRKKGDAWSWRNGTGLELMNVSGFQQQQQQHQQGEQDKRRGRDTSWPIEADSTERREKGGVIKSDSKYEIGMIPGSEPGSSGKWGKQRRQQVSSSVGGSSKSRKSKGEKEGERKWVGGRKKTEKTNDSISKRLELIHELNQKILANYERFQQRSRSKSHGAKEGKCEGSRSKKEQQQGGNGRGRGSGTDEGASREARKEEEEEDVEAKQRKSSSSSRGAKPAQRSCKDQDSCPRERKVDASNKKQQSSKPSSSSSSSCSSSKSRTFRDNDNFTMAARPGFCEEAEDKKEAEYCSGSLRNEERKSVFYSTRRDKDDREDTDRLGSSRLYPERCNDRSNEARTDDLEEISRSEEAKIERGISKERDRSAIDEIPRGGCEERLLDGEEEGREEEESAWERRRKATSATGKKKKRRDKLGSEGLASESGGGGCSATSGGEPMTGAKVARLQETFDSSWDSGVGVDVGNGGSGWVRIHTGIESSLVYLTVDTTARDVCRDMLLGDDLSLFMQVSGPPQLSWLIIHLIYDAQRLRATAPVNERGTNMLMRYRCSV